MDIQIYVFLHDKDYEKLNEEYKKKLHNITKGYFHPLRYALYIDKFSKGIVFILPFINLEFVHELIKSIKKNNEGTTSYSSLMVKIT